MNLRGGKSSETDKWAASHGAFVTATCIAVVLAAVIITLARMGASTSGFFEPLPASDEPSVTPPAPAYDVGTSKGSPDAPVTIISYTDFQCYYCQQFFLTTEKELEKVYVDTGKVRLVYKHFILQGEESLLAAQAAECAAEQGKFWPYADLLMEIRAEPGKNDLTEERLESVARQVGLDMATFRTSLQSGKYKEKVDQDTADGRAAGVTSTPTFFINGIKGVGSPAFETWQELIEELLRRAGK
jgi:protein-disulfide isomerase